jgi:sugar phosphate isomerase/epimerase
VARLGLMLYTVRDECARDFSATLQEVGAIGFEGVELFDLHGRDPAEVARMLHATGLVACGRHASLEAIESGLPELAGEAAELGWRRLVVGWVDPARLDATLVGRLETAADQAAAHGLELGFHNHAAEAKPLDGGGSFLDALLAREKLFLELDLGWAWYAGVDPIALLGSARGRCPLVHVKDFYRREEGAFAPVGDGAVGYERVGPAAVDAGVEWLLVEQDETDGPALEAARRSLAALGAMLEVTA